ncbi:MAG: hypothetical protein DRP74_05975 [Candidatus Omnitrophota bacterium]|nr:MAG: hypothetical protein DRP74_05975 [Candidatus Omnitrophota bacterium]
MHRFYIPSPNINQDKICLSAKKQLHHIKDVLRLKVNNKLIIFDDKAREFKVIVEQLSKENIIFKIQGQLMKKSLNKMSLTIACAIPKKSKMDEIVDKLTQLGVERIIPMLTKRVVVKLSADKKLLKQARWKKVAIAAAQQSQRKKLPSIDEIKHIKEVLSEAKKFDLKLIPNLTEKSRTLRETLDQTRPENILVLIGPEGDFTSEEIRLAEQAGFLPLTLGEQVLRVETAAVAIAGFINLYEPID